jgi:hypothetical protein
MVGEELKGGQKKIDKNHNGKIDGQDFAILRGQKEKVAEESELNLEDFSLEEIEEFMVSEEFEQLDELSKSTLGSYVNKASDSATKSASGSTSFAFRSTAAKNPRVKAAAEKYSNEDEAKKQKRLSGIGKAVKKLTKEDIEQIDELKKSTLGSYVKKASTDLHHSSFEHGEDEHRQYGDAEDDPEREADMKKRERDIENRRKGINRAATKLSKESIDSAAATILEYESKDGKFVHKARPGAYGGTKDERHAVDTMSGPKEKDLKAIESEKKKKKFSEDLDLYKEGGIKGLFEAWAKKKAMKEEQEQISEEPTSAEFDAQLDDAKQRAAGTKKQSEISKASVQAVQNEETHTTVEVWDLDTTNGVQISEIDLEERTLTEPETKKKEEIVKSMKKGIAGFKDRYGDRAKEVMYATATARAKGE